MAPVGGMRDSLRIEGWFAVLEEMVGRDLLQGHDVIPRAANRQVVVQQREEPEERLVTRMWTIAEVIQTIGKAQEEVYRTPVWHDMARCVGTRWCGPGTSCHREGHYPSTDHEGHTVKVP